MLDNQLEYNLTRTASSDTDTDVPSTPWYGWLFSTITAFGMLLFLTLSFTCYHRRLIERRKRSEEYLSYFSIVRPDLDFSGTKITRARSSLTNVYSIGTSYLTNECEHDNEACQVVADSKRWNSEDDQNDQTEWMKLDTDKLDTEKKNTHINKGVGDKMYLTDSGKMRRNQLLTDIYSQAKVTTDVDINEMIGCNATNLHGEQPPQSHDIHCTAGEDMKQLDIEQFSSKPTDNKIVQLSCEVVAQKPPKMTGKRKTKLPVNEDIDGMYIFKVRKKKKKRHYLKSLNSSYKKNAISLDEEHSVQFYSQPRRQSEPSLYCYTEEEVNPHGNKAFYNPYYMETGQPLANDSRQCANINSSTSNEQPKFELIRSNLQPQPLPSLDNAYHEHISTSTWM